jgi:hypothetical protein
MVDYSKAGWLQYHPEDPHQGKNRDGAYAKNGVATICLPLQA